MAWFDHRLLECDFVDVVEWHGFVGSSEAECSTWVSWVLVPWIVPDLEYRGIAGNQYRIERYPRKPRLRGAVGLACSAYCGKKDCDPSSASKQTRDCWKDQSLSFDSPLDAQDTHDCDCCWKTSEKKIGELWKHCERMSNIGFVGPGSNLRSCGCHRGFLLSQSLVTIPASTANAVHRSGKNGWKRLTTWKGPSFQSAVTNLVRRLPCFCRSAW